MLTRTTRQEADVYHLPGRDFYLYIGPDNSEAKNVALGVAVFAAGAAPPGHIHPAEEEVIYIVSGSGELVGGVLTAGPHRLEAAGSRHLKL